jgi:hypothetical protein
VSEKERETTSRRYAVRPGGLVGREAVFFFVFDDALRCITKTEGLIKLIHHGGSHDRFIIIDNKRLYHLGASLKDLGKRYFAFSQMDHLLPLIREKLSEKYWENLTILKKEMEVIREKYDLKIETSIST